MLGSCPPGAGGLGLDHFFHHAVPGAALRAAAHLAGRCARIADKRKRFVSLAINKTFLAVGLAAALKTHRFFAVIALCGSAAVDPLQNPSINHIRQAPRSELVGGDGLRFGFIRTVLVVLAIFGGLAITQQLDLFVSDGNQHGIAVREITSQSSASERAIFNLLLDDPAAAGERPSPDRSLQSASSSSASGVERSAIWCSSSRRATLLQLQLDDLLDVFLVRASGRR